MNKLWKGICVAAISFLCGVKVNTFFSPIILYRVPETNTHLLSPRPPALDVAIKASNEAAAREWGETPEGMEWKEKNNGFPLPLRDEALSARDMAEAKVIPLSSGRFLAGIGDTIYMIDHQWRIGWKHREPPILLDFAFVEATRMVYATAGDNTMFILDADTGATLLRESRNGKAGYGAVVPYGKDQCLVMDNFSGYRSTEDFIPPMSDGVTAWRGTKMIWRHKVPPDAELEVSGNRIFAVTKTPSRILIDEIVAPQNSL